MEPVTKQDQIKKTDKITLVLGASLNPGRYSYRAVKMLRKYGHTVYAIGKKRGVLDEVEIQTGFHAFENVHTVTLYLSRNNQIMYYDYILSLKPKRIIYNPGAENEELERLAAEKNIENMEACTLVMLSTNQY